MCQTSVNLAPCCIKHTSRFYMCRSTISLSKITREMWHDYPFGQMNKTTERAVGLALEATGKGELGNITVLGNVSGVFMKYGDLRPLFQISFVLGKSYKESISNLNNLSLIQEAFPILDGTRWTLYYFSSLDYKSDTLEKVVLSHHFDTAHF